MLERYLAWASGYKQNNVGKWIESVTKKNYHLGIQAMQLWCNKLEAEIKKSVGVGPSYKKMWRLTQDTSKTCK